jgi:hypothetical protein
MAGPDGQLWHVHCTVMTSEDFGTVQQQLLQSHMQNHQPDARLNALVRDFHVNLTFAEEEWDTENALEAALVVQAATPGAALDAAVDLMLGGCAAMPVTAYRLMGGTVVLMPRDHRTAELGW